MTARLPVRAVFASEFWPGASARGLVPGFRDRGWLVDEVDVSHYLKPRPSLAGRIEGRLRRRQSLAAFQQAIIDSVDRHDARVFITVKGVGVEASTLRKLRKRGVFLLNYYPDNQFNDTPIELLANYDLVVTTKSFQVAELSGTLSAERVGFLHHGYSPEHHRPIATSEKQRDVDILYIGNASQAKAEFLIALAAALPEARMRVIGDRWLTFARGTALEPAIVGQVLHGDYYAGEIARAKIVLAVHMGVDRRTGFEDLVSTRTFEIPACGGFMLHVDNPEVRSLFAVPGEVDTFATAAELVDKVHYWLAHPEERQAVAARGHARAVPAYSYVKRANELARMVEERL